MPSKCVKPQVKKEMNFDGHLIVDCGWGRNGRKRFDGRLIVDGGRMGGIDLMVV